MGEKLSKRVNCQVSWDDYARNFYSVDSSSYTLKPSIVVFPKNELDIIKIIKFAKKYHIPATARGGGTGLVGSALGSGIIIDMKNLNKISLGTNHVKVDAGVFKGHLDKILKKQGKFIGPNPSIGPFCTVGGMIGTNASGARSLKYGSMIDNLIEVKLVNAFGNMIKLPNSQHAKQVLDIIPSNIEKVFPKVSKNSCGYRIDKIYSKTDVHKIIAGSEGTLGIIVSAKIRTYKIPKNILLCIISYKTLLEAAKDVSKINELKPSAVELVDNNIVKHIKIKIPSQTECILFVEFYDNIKQNIKQIRDITSGRIIKIETNIKKITELWGFRNSALVYSLKSITKNETMPTLIEDAVVPVKRLPLLLKILDIISKKYGLKMIVYGHAGNGNLHIRPILKRRDRHLIKKIASEFFIGVIGIGGSITGEHGDGLARSEFVKLQYGKQVYSVFKDIKNHFDPQNILNPGKIISNQSTVTKNLKI
ncbi:MAG: FAD-binding oxidoreductase [Thaumarchaeota archaeon]|nr:FAD-binding oxidoreductase [Nitrososphaerota archaeon]